MKHFSEGYGEMLIILYTKLYDSLNSYLSQFPNTNLISGIQFYKLYQDQPENLQNLQMQLERIFGLTILILQ